MRAVVTGASRGIGRATALRLGRAGYEVLVHYRRSEAEAEDVAGEIRAVGGAASIVRADLSESADVERLVASVRRDPRPLDALVHNAGEYPRAGLGELDPATVRRVLEVHVVAPLELTRRLAEPLRAAGPGRVVFLSSILAFDGSRHGAHYAAAKAAVLGLVRSLAVELAPAVRVNAVAPGSIDTAILAGDTPEARRRREATIPLGRVGAPEEVARAIAYLCEPSGYETGTTLHVNGGLRRG